jgi:hypothetical protein
MNSTKLILENQVVIMKALLLLVSSNHEFYKELKYNIEFNDQLIKSLA